MQAQESCEWHMLTKTCQDFIIVNSLGVAMVKKGGSNERHLQSETWWVLPRPATEVRSRILSRRRMDRVGLHELRSTECPEGLGV